MSSLASLRGARSDRFLQALAPYRRILIVMHDNPDPDAIATGWAITCLIQDRLDRPTRLVAGGAIVRAENRYMVELLQPPVELVDGLEPDRETGAILVDCSLGASNQMLTRHSIDPVAVIDHHLHAAGISRVAHCDIRPTAAASASIAAVYLREQSVEPGPKLSTALLYAIRTEVCGASARFSPLDRSVILWLTERADLELLAEIENAPLTREYYGDLVLAMQNAFLYDDSALCFLPRAAGADLVGEVADLLIRCEGVHRVLCGAFIGDDLLLSVRTEGERDNAVALLQATVEDLGRGGGHANRAGGKVPNVEENWKNVDQLQNELRSRWLTACGIDRQRGYRLVAKREIVEHL